MFSPTFFDKRNDAKAFFRAYGSFGDLRGEIKRDGKKLLCEADEYTAVCTYETDELGVVTRRDSITNTSDKNITVDCFKSRFVFEDGEYQVYTQFNNWQTESAGEWQKLVTSITAGCESTRTCQDATPFMVLWNEQESRGVAFHLMPDCMWDMKAARCRSDCKYSKIVVDIGASDKNYHITLAPGESVSAPEIICYEIRNKLDMDAYKLHNYMHVNYPRKNLPVIYDTWMGFFDHFDFEKITKQIELAADLGVEYFFIDAGWFGNGASWAEAIGDWTENMTGAFCGRMTEVSELVRKAGMKFGLWLEPERACPTSESVKNHREYYIESNTGGEECFFLDFSNDEAREWMLGLIDGLIEKYKIEYMKDDFNADLYFDIYSSAHQKYFEGQKKFVDELRRRHPDLYLSSCASGGTRMELNTYRKFDSTWPSDNENPYTEMRIYKDTIIRMPPQHFEKWVAGHSLVGYEDFYKSFERETDKFVACGDAVWQHIVGVNQSYLNGYMTGGPIGISSDISRWSEGAKNNMRSFISKFKAEREFWKSAVARIICDTASVTAYEYSDMKLKKIVVHVFTNEPKQDVFCVHPVIDETKKYLLNGEKVLSGKQIADEGIEFFTESWHDNWHTMMEARLEEV